MALRRTSSVSSAIPQTQSTRWRRIRSTLKVPSGWRFSLLSGAVLAVGVLLVNIGVLLWAVTQPTAVGDGDGRRILFDGSCDKAKNINTALHVLINVLSSLLLGASNYGMQCLSAPTRTEVDRAHARGASLEIGIPSTRNIGSISSKRLLLWLLLALSSLPLHFLYNSVVFSSLSARNYRVLAADESFTSADYAFEADGRYDNMDNYIIGGGGFYKFNATRDVVDFELRSLQRLAATGGLQNLTNGECIDAYGTPFLTSRSDVVVVVGQLGDDNPSLAGYDATMPPLMTPCQAGVNADDDNHHAFSWMCPRDTCRLPCSDQLRSFRTNAASWELPMAGSHLVTYCLSKTEEEHCRLNFSVLFAAIVVAANALKATVLVFTLLNPPDEPLLVLGDAISSFLVRPDPYTTGMSLATSRTARPSWRRTLLAPTLWNPVRKRWRSAARLSQWIVNMALYLGGITTISVYLFYAIKSMSGATDLGSLWDLGFGTTSEKTLVSFQDQPQAGSLGSMVVLANTPHVIFSLLYFRYNSMFTRMLAAREWSSFGVKRKPLRVSAAPAGAQRARYFLQLPYRFGVPLIGFSVVVHWLMSQSIFVVAVENLDQSSPSWYMITCGYSPIAIIFVLVLCCLLVTAVVATGCLRLPSAIPVVGSCSLAIAAACHGPDGQPQTKAALAPLRWGVISPPSWKDPGHCGFSAEEVGEPEEGCHYGRAP
ncbi:hypothetical protein B0T24DRAFT_643184 [Lasiosphaeria ovina]|uniref:DUF6536 domain-containing protein n=1 Tax=Lasiosphaeria ovina TaxID=92902 RepID=A0AAE0JSE5_9PEZI|nr:hypothetical protein B0T24DRAFT_643184 [Lasiosphaeria ovina]